MHAVLILSLKNTSGDNPALEWGTVNFWVSPWGVPWRALPCTKPCWALCFATSFQARCETSLPYPRFSDVSSFFQNEKLYYHHIRLLLKLPKFPIMNVVHQNSLISVLHPRQYCFKAIPFTAVCTRIN